MEKAIKVSLFISVFFCLSIFTSINVLASSNNKFGIHITQAEDLPRAIELVNSSGGDWGYVTIVIQDIDKDREKWQKIFDLFRENHLIPLVRIATHLKGNTWEKPADFYLEDMANFLDDLNWPVKDQYIIIFNEPNHSKEWGSGSNASEYARILDKALTVFKQKNPDFLILNAGLDQAAPNSVSTIDELRFLDEMEKTIPGIFNRLDGWVSHSYPNHGFIGKPWETGRATVKGYEWELFILKNNYGLTKDLPVFITETGWPHKIISSFQFPVSNYYDENLTAEYMKYAFEKVWLPDERIVAVTPFILNYPYYPFDNFTWLDIQGNPYPQYERIKSMPKTKGEPEQKTALELLKSPLPPLLTTNLIFRGKVSLKNIGQSIWGEKPFRLKAYAPGLKLTDLVLPSGMLVKPGQTAQLGFTLETPGLGGDYLIAWEGLTPYEVRVFGVWGLTTSKNTSLNNLIEEVFGFWSNL